MKTIQTQAIISGVRSRVDRSLGVSFSTPELSAPEKALFMELQGINCEFLIKPLDERTEVEKIDREVETKTPSMRLRAVIFILWKQEGEPGDFQQFYKDTMEKFINHVKGKLEQQ